MGGVTRSRTAGFIRRATWAANKQEHTDTLDRVAARPRRWGTRKVKETVKGSTSYNKSQRQGLRHAHQEEQLTRFRVGQTAKGAPSVRLDSYSASDEAGKPPRLDAQPKNVCRRRQGRSVVTRESSLVSPNAQSLQT